MDNLERALERDSVVRSLGVLCLALGAFLTYLVVNIPTAGVAAEGHTTSLLRCGPLVAFGTLLGGLILLIAGRRVRRFMVLKWCDATPLQVCGTLLLALVCVAFQWWFDRNFSRRPGEGLHAPVTRPSQGAPGNASPRTRPTATPSNQIEAQQCGLVG
jgi:hypothetical protein